jgi:hydroxyethylthiazole kinase
VDAGLLGDPDLRTAAPVIAQVRSAGPMVHCITAAVSMGIVADGLLAAGARPMMTETVQEAPVITPLADALLVNLGTLSTDGMEGIPVTVRAAQEAGRPWVLDPTAIGRAPVRTPLARDLLADRPAVVRGNASEILALVGGSGGRGPDADAATEDHAEITRRAAHEVAQGSGAVVAVSGPEDLLIAPGTDHPPRSIPRGHPLLTRVTGTGCLLGALTAACLGAGATPADAARAATVWMDVAGERAATRAPRPGSFRTALLDALDELGEVARAIHREGTDER